MIFLTFLLDQKSYKKVKAVGKKATRIRLFRYGRKTHPGKEKDV
jgi:hypothetical protein